MPQGYSNQHHSVSSSLYMRHDLCAEASAPMVTTSQGHYPAHAPQIYEDLYVRPEGVHTPADKFDVHGWHTKNHSASHAAVGQTFHVVGSGVAGNKELANGGEVSALRAARLEQQSQYNGYNVITGKDHPNCATPVLHAARQNGAQIQEAAIAQKELRLEAQRARIGELRKNRISNDGLVYSQRNRSGCVKDSISWSGSQ
ncbi:MAG: hypothetical protein WDW36_010235 [Sanguina aurantia]